MAGASEMTAASACLCGINCRYNGKNSFNNNVVELFNRGVALPLCPEQLGGLAIPRPPYEITGGTGRDVLDGKARILSRDGIDSTENFIAGAKRFVSIIKALGIKKVILKSKSPSCGYGRIYDGTFTGSLIPGNGVLAELLLQEGIEVIAEEELRVES